MKKLLAAVTSIVMSASFATSAFASSMTVSAASGVSAVQPNVSMGEVLGAAANKKAQADFIVTAPDFTISAGESKEIEFTVSSGGHKGILINTEVGTLPGGLKYELSDPTVYAVDIDASYSKVGTQYHASVKNPKTSDASPFNDGEAILTLKVTAPSNATAGTYDYGLELFHVVEDAFAPIEFDATIKKGKVTITGGSSTTPTQGNTTQPTQSADAVKDFVITAPDYTADPGDKVEVEFKVSSGSHKVVLAQCELDIPSELKPTVSDPTVYCVDHDAAYTALGTKQWTATLKDPKTSDAVALNDDEPIMCVELTIPSDAAGKKYQYGMKMYHVVEDAFKPIEFDATVEYGTITVTGQSSTEPSKSTEPTSSTSKSTSKPTNPTQSPDAVADFIITAPDYTANPGEKVDVEFGVSSGSHKVVLAQCELDIPAALNPKVSDPTVYCVEHDVSYTALGTKQWTATFKDPKTSDAVALDDSEAIMCVEVTIPSSAKAGDTYQYGMKFYHVVEDAFKPIEFDATVKYGTITVGGQSSTEPTKNTDPTKSTEPTKGTDPTQSPDAIADFIITAPDYSVKPGETFDVEFGVSSGSHKVVLAQCEFDIPAALSPKVSDPTVYCVEHDVSYTALGTKQWTATFKDPKTSDAVALDDSEPIMCVTVSVPASAKAGTQYQYGMKFYHVVEDAFKPIEFDATVKYGTITVIGEEEKTTTTSTTTTKKPEDTTTTSTTKPVEPADGKAEWVIDTVKAAPGETVEVKVYVNGASDLAVAGASYVIAPKAPIAFKSVSDKSAAYNGAIVSNPDTNEFAFSNATGAGTAAADKAVVMTLSYTVPAGTAAGTYPLTWGTAEVADTNGNIITSKVTLTNGAIVVEGEPVAQGNIEWVIDTVKAKAGETVQVPVLVKDADAAALAVAGAQFQIDAKAPIAFESVAGSDAYKADIVNNKATNEFAFGETAGKAIAAADGAKVAVLTYTVPADCAAGTYPLTWSNAFISDGDGNSITGNVKLTNGAIVVEAPVVVDGDITWTIPEVEAAPGETVEMNVLVSVGDKNLAVAGAQFNVSAKAPIAFASATGSDAYGSAIVNNATTNEFAFGQAKGQGVEAKDGSVVLKLTYTVPADCAAGKYPVEWSNAFISDENGNDITAKVALVKGAIIITKPDETTTTTTTTTTAPATTTTTTTAAQPETTTTTTTTASAQPETTTTTTTASAQPETTTTTTVSAQPETTTTTTTAPAETTATTATEPPVTLPVGVIAWQIDTVTAAPGDEVTLKVVVRDPSALALPIAGAQYVIKAVAPISYVGGSDASTAYGAAIVSNAATSEYAFADAKGNGVAAANGAVVMTLTYKVPEDCKEGTYPVAFGTDFMSVSSADGLDMTAQVLPMDGAIIVRKPVETTTSSSATSTTQTTAPAETTTTTTTTVSVPKGVIIWQAETVTAEPGDEVQLKVIVKDPYEVKLPVAGAQFLVNISDESIALTQSTGCEAYSVNLVSNKNEFAFATPDGSDVAGIVGSAVVTLTYKVPEDIQPGTYPVTIDGLVAYDTNINDVTKNIWLMDGAIIVRPATTTAPATTTTTAQPETTTTTTTTAAQPETTTTSTTAAQPETTTTTTTATATGSVETTTTTTASAQPETTTTSTTAAQPETTTTSTTVAQPETTTTTTTTAAPETTTTTTTRPIPVGAIGWNLDTVVGKPGDTVTLTMVVSNPHGADINVGGGQFVLASDFDMASAEGTPYGYVLEYNAETGEFAFASKDGTGAASVDGAVLVKVSYTIPETAQPGNYPVKVGNIVAHSGDDVDLSANILGGNGLIIVLPAETTTTSTTTTTTKAPETTTTTTTATATGSVETTTTTTGAESTTTTTTTATGTGSVETTTTTTTTQAPETTTTTTTATATGSVETTTTTTTGADSTTTTTTTATGTGTVETTTTTTTGAESTTATTTTKGIVAPGSTNGTTATGPGGIVPGVAIEAKVTVVDGFYFSHDPRTFKVEHVIADEVVVTDEDGNQTAQDFDPLKLAFVERVSGKSTPLDVFTESTNVYNIDVCYGGKPLLDSDGNQVTFKVFIGVKGDTNFDNSVDAKDASNVLRYYAAVSTGEKNAVLSTADIVKERPELDELAAFLADVDKDVYSEGNWATKKADRAIDAKDASKILAFYAEKSTGLSDAHVAWNKVFEDVTPKRTDLWAEYIK